MPKSIGEEIRIQDTKAGPVLFQAAPEEAVSVSNDGKPQPLNWDSRPLLWKTVDYAVPQMRIELQSARNGILALALGFGSQTHHSSMIICRAGRENIPLKALWNSLR